MISVALVDEHASVRWGLREFLSQEPDIEIAAEAMSGRGAQELARDPRLSVMLLDISLPDQNGIDVLKFIHARSLPIRILMVSSFPEASYAMTAMRSGAAGYLNKDCSPAELVSAIRTVHAGRKYISPAVAEIMAQAFVDREVPKHEQLSQRQMQVFLRLAMGERAAQIAAALSLSPQTISGIAKKVKDTLGLRTMAELTNYAVKQGLIQ